MEPATTAQLIFEDLLPSSVSALLPSIFMLAVYVPAHTPFYQKTKKKLAEGESWLQVFFSAFNETNNNLIGLIAGELGMLTRKKTRLTLNRTWLTLNRTWLTLNRTWLTLNRTRLTLNRTWLTLNRSFSILADRTSQDPGLNKKKKKEKSILWTLYHS